MEFRIGKVVAVGVRFASKGSAVFAMVDDRLCCGVCMMKLMFIKGFFFKDGD